MYEESSPVERNGSSEEFKQIEQVKPPAMGVMKGPPMIGKLNLGALPPKEDELMKEQVPAPQKIDFPKKGGFSLDISKAQK